MHTRQTQPRAGSPAACGIAGHALVSARLSEIAGLRDRPGPPGAPALAARFLRHSDEHTVVGMHAILAVLAARGIGPADVARDAVVAASCQPGRLTAARTLANLATGGGVSVSPHIVPQCSLHSVAGAVSVGLGMRGPHLGVGGGPDALAEGLFAAATLVHAATTSDDPSRVWLVVTEWDAEPVLDDAGVPVGDPVCRGLAVAVEADASSLALTLHVPGSQWPRLAAPPADGGLAQFARALDMCHEGTALVAWTVACPSGMEIRVGRRAAPAARPAATARSRAAA